MNDFQDVASLETPWWIDSSQTLITPYDYPEKRLKAAKDYAKQNRIKVDDYLQSIKKQSFDDVVVLLKVATLVQDMLIHNPVFQPSQKRPFAIKPYVRALLLRHSINAHELVYDPVLLFMLGEARCGQVASVLVELLAKTGIKAKIEKLNNHIVANVILNGQ